MKRKRWKEPAGRFLEATTDIRVRFQEVDALGIVWHGHYIAYFEQAREAFGDRYGLEYLTMREHGFAVPLVHLDLDYFAPATLGETVTVRARMHPQPGAWLQHTYLVTNRQGERLATGRTVHAFTDLSGELFLTPPPFLEDWLARHENQLCEEST